MTVSRLAIAACLLAAVATPAWAQPAPSGTPDRPFSQGTGSTVTGSPSMSPGGTQKQQDEARPGGTNVSPGREQRSVAPTNGNGQPAR